MNDISLQQTALQTQIKNRAIVVSYIANLARTIYKPGVTIRFYDRTVEPVRTDDGTVLDVDRDGSEVTLRVTPKRGRRVRVVKVEDILGIMLETR